MASNGNNVEERQNKTVKIGDDTIINCRLSATTRFFINQKQTLTLTHTIDYKWFKYESNSNDHLNETARLVSVCSAKRLD